MEFVVGTIVLSCEMYSLWWSCFRSCGIGTLCTENCVSCYTCSAVEVAWLAQNIRRSSRPTRVHGRRKGGASPLDFENISKIGCFLSFEWEKTNFTTFGPPPGKILEKSPGGPPWKKYFRRPYTCVSASTVAFRCL